MAFLKNIASDGAWGGDRNGPVKRGGGSFYPETKGWHPAEILLKALCVLHVSFLPLS
jgi:hypothetical protein